MSSTGSNIMIQCIAKRDVIKTMFEIRVLSVFIFVSTLWSIFEISAFNPKRILYRPCTAAFRRIRYYDRRCESFCHSFAILAYKLYDPQTYSRAFIKAEDYNKIPAVLFHWSSSGLHPTLLGYTLKNVQPFFFCNSITWCYCRDYTYNFVT